MTTTISLPPTMLSPEIDPALGGRDRIPAWLRDHPAWVSHGREPHIGPWSVWDAAWAGSAWFLSWSAKHGEPIEDHRLSFTGANVGLRRTALRIPDCLSMGGEPLEEFAKILQSLEGQHVELDDSGRGIVAVVKGGFGPIYHGPWSRDGVAIGVGPLKLGGRPYGPPAADPPVDGLDALKLIVEWIRGKSFGEVLEEDRQRREEEKRIRDAEFAEWVATSREKEGGKPRPKPKPAPAVAPMPQSSSPVEPVRPGRRPLPWQPYEVAQLYPANLASLADAARRGPADADGPDEAHDQPTERLPDELRDARSWIVWRYEDRENKRGEVHSTKVLYQPRNPALKARSNDPATWSSHDEALRVYLARLGEPDGVRFDGVGFCFEEGGGIVGIDFDRAIDGSGRIAEWARPLIDACLEAAIYGEPSPSGRGLKFWLRGSTPGDAGRKRFLGEGRDRPGVEVYARGRYFTVTGRRLWTKKPGDGQAAIDAALAWIDEPHEAARREKEARKAVLDAERQRRLEARQRREEERRKAAPRSSSSPSTSGGFRPGFIRWQSLKPHIDLVAVAETLLGPPDRVDAWDDRAWWPCPFHADSRPSFNVSPDVNLWVCYSKCGGGDAADFVMRLEGLTFPDAAKRLLRMLHRGEAGDGEARDVQRHEPRLTGPDYDLAGSLVNEAAERLWTPDGAVDLDHLRGRGLTDATIRRHRLGSSDSFPLPARSGEEEATRATSGIVIPWTVDGRVERIQIRRRQGEPRYLLVQQRSPLVYPSPETIVPGRPLVFVEGELDALLLGQELGEAASVITVGSAARGLPDAVTDLAIASPRWFAAHDADEAGDAAAARLPSRAVRARPPQKDWCEVHKADPSAIRRIWGSALGCDFSQKGV